jgi:hypothetical protein
MSNGEETRPITKRQFGLMLDEIWSLWEDPLTLDEFAESTETFLGLSGDLLTWVKEWVAFQKSSVDGTIRFINSMPAGDGDAKTEET